MSKHVELFRTEIGRWEWNEVLMLVEFVTKGRRRPDVSFCLSSPQNNHRGAMMKALREELEFQRHNG